MDKQPAKVFISYAAKDERFLETLQKHLSLLMRGGTIQLWHHGLIAAGQDMKEVKNHALHEADLILFLLSADFLVSDESWKEMEIASTRSAVGKARVIPIIARPCDWRMSPVGTLLSLPRDGVPLALKPDEDKAWADIAAEIRDVLRFSADSALPQALEHFAVTPRTAIPGREIRSIEDIFPTTGQPEITLVEPAQLPRLRLFLRAMGSGLVVEGPSGVGKTTVVKMALALLQASQHEWLLGQDPGDRATLDERLQHGFKGHLVIDDFHQLDRPRQERVAAAMKVISDRNRRDAKITAIGINPVGDSLVSSLPDLAGRFEVVAMGRQPIEKIDELVRKGEEAANIVFRRRHELITAAAGSLFTAQQLCYYAAIKAGIDATATEPAYVDVGFRDVLEEVLRNLEGKYYNLVRSFACHDERVPPRGGSLALLFLLAQSQEGHVTLDDAHYQFQDADVRAALGWLKSSNLARCFDETPRLKSLFYYNKSAGVLSIEDPRLAFYLRHMSWSAFLEKTNHRNARIETEGRLVFRQRTPSTRPGPAEELVHVLHLSDLHFSQLAQADVWFVQLAEDLRELECDHVDALVLSGDLTQRADPMEFEAARRFLLRLSTEFKISPGQVVLVPGNHDLSWPLSRSAYTLHRRGDYTSPLQEGKFIAHGAEVVEVREETAYQRRFEPFSGFYGLIKGTPYPLEPAEQFEIQDFPKENLLFLGLSSAWETDHIFRDRASVHPEALARALARIRQSPSAGQRLKIAVWHHPLAGSGEDRIKDHGVMQQLAKAGFRLVLHGHIHKAETGLFRYDMSPEGRKIDVISAGTFGAPTMEWVPGYPLQYNLLRISKQRVVVETRRREEPNGAWQPDARWLQGPGKDPLPRYEIAR